MQPSWRLLGRGWCVLAKTAMIIVRVEEALRKSGHEVSFEAIGKRIESLAGEGRLDSQGDLTLWRHSEVRIADPKTV